MGVKLILAGVKKDGKPFKHDQSTGKTLMPLSFAISIDAFAVGLSIVFLKVPAIITVIAIGLITFLLSVTGIFAGSRLGETFGRRVEILGGLILIAIGIRVVISHSIV